MTTNELTKAVILYLTAHGHMVMRVNNSGAKGRVNVVSKGCPDLVGCTKTGRALFIEIKNKQTKDKLSDYQKEVKRNVELRDGLYIVVTELKDIEEARIR